MKKKKTFFPLLRITLLMLYMVHNIPPTIVHIPKHSHIIYRYTLAQYNKSSFAISKALTVTPYNFLSRSNEKKRRKPNLFSRCQTWIMLLTSRVKNVSCGTRHTFCVTYTLHEILYIYIRCIGTPLYTLYFIYHNGTNNSNFSHNNNGLYRRLDDPISYSFI